MGIYEQLDQFILLEYIVQHVLRDIIVLQVFKPYEQQAHTIQNTQQPHQLIVFHANTEIIDQIQFHQRLLDRKVKHVEKAYQVFLVQLID